MGDTTTVRSLLSLPAGPQPNNVIKHLQNTAQARNAAVAANTASKTVSSSTQVNVSQAYKIIVDTVSNLLATSGNRHELDWITAMLHAPWVLVQDKRFVSPEMLYFDLDEETTEGKM